MPPSLDLYMAKGNQREALRAFNKALDGDPFCVAILLKVGRIQLDLGEFEDAEGTADKILATARTHEQASTLKKKGATRIFAGFCSLVCACHSKESVLYWHCFLGSRLFKPVIVIHLLPLFLFSC